MHHPVVLLVEDDPLIQLHSRMVLEDAGYEVLASYDADDALAQLAGRDDVAALFTDVQLPGTLGGVELARRVHDIRPDMSIVVTSGKHAPDGHALPEGGRFMPKPYTAAQLRQALAG